MRPAELALIYLMLGACVAVRDAATGGRTHLWSFFLWPLVLPGLLAPTDARYETAPSTHADLRASLRSAGVPEPDIASLERGLADLDRRLKTLDSTLASSPEPRAPGSSGPEAKLARAEQQQARDQLLALRARLLDRREAAEARLGALRSRLTLHAVGADDAGDLTRTLQALVAALAEADC